MAFLYAPLLPIMNTSGGPPVSSEAHGFRPLRREAAHRRRDTVMQTESPPSAAEARSFATQTRSTSPFSE